jgi:hypothetical protein
MSLPGWLLRVLCRLGRHVLTLERDGRHYVMVCVACGRRWDARDHDRELS